MGLVGIRLWFRRCRQVGRLENPNVRNFGRPDFKTDLFITAYFGYCQCGIERVDGVSLGGSGNEFDPFIAKALEDELFTA